MSQGYAPQQVGELVQAPSGPDQELGSGWGWQPVLHTSRRVA